MRPFLSFKRQDQLLERTATTGQKLIASACCLNSYLFSQPQKSLYFRLTSGQTSSEKNFLKKFYWLKRTAMKFQGDYWGSILPRTSLPKIAKNTLLSLKRQLLLTAAFLASKKCDLLHSSVVFLGCAYANEHSRQ